MYKTFSPVLNLWNVPNPIVEGKEPVVPKPTLVARSALNEILCSTFLIDAVASAP